MHRREEGSKDIQCSAQNATLFVECWYIIKDLLSNLSGIEAKNQNGGCEFIIEITQRISSAA